MNTAPLAVDSSYIVSCTCVKEADGRVKTIIITPEPVNYMTLTDAEGRNYGECHNFCEPFAFLDHMFYLPEGTLDKPVTLNFINRRANSKYFEAWQPGTTTLNPEQVAWTTMEDFIRENDHHITPREIEEFDVCDGVSCQILTCVNDLDLPVRMFAMFVDPKKAYFATATADDGYANHTKIQTIMGMAEAAIANGKEVVGAINADFFDMFAERSPFMPSGLCIKDGQVLCNPHSTRTFFGMDRAGNPVISSFAEEPHLKGQLLCAVGGREIMLRDGEIAEVSPCERFFSVTCHPRTCVGIREDGTTIILVVDGRAPELSNGASIVDLARAMQYFGAKKAINLDGGGSSTFIARKDGELTMLNFPADLNYPGKVVVREVFNGVLVVKK
ncbi:MAG: phosphodiester glycosidase family protein [Oscillospiraceae bacterium]|nr:phosphodiester glycosidase family protein [Oscillospiraceae bacterium]